MPQLRTVNLRRDDPDKPEPSGVETFFSNLAKVYTEDRDKKELDNIISGYQNNRNDENALEDLFLNIDKSKMGPTKQLEATQRIKLGLDAVAARDKVVAEKMAAVNKANAPGKKTQASQPIDPEQLDNIRKVRRMPEYEGASPSKKYQMLTDNNVSRENAEAETKIYADESKDTPGKEFSKGREKAVLDYVSSSLDKYKAAQELEPILQDVETAISGEVEGPGYKAAIKNNPVGQLLVGLTPDEAALQSANKKLLGGTKSIFGSKPTEREIFLLLNSMLPSIGKTYESNKAGVDFLKKYNDLELMHGEIVDELTDGGTQFVPDLERQVRQRMKPLGDAFLGELRQEKSRQSKEKPANNKQNNAQKYRAPDGSEWNMTPEQVENAKAQGVIFEPVK